MQLEGDTTTVPADNLGISERKLQILGLAKNPRNRLRYLYSNTRLGIQTVFDQRQLVEEEPKDRKRDDK